MPTNQSFYKKPKSLKRVREGQAAGCVSKSAYQRPVVVARDGLHDDH